MVEIDMTREPESGLLLGVNLWEVRDCKVEKSQSSGTNMMRIKLKCGDHEFSDQVMLEGKGWKFGRPRLIALGLKPDFVGSLDPIKFIGAKVWVATKEESYQGVDRKTGAPRTFTNCKVDIDQLAFCGYQPEHMVPPGAAVPVTTGMGPDDTPF